MGLSRSVNSTEKPSQVTSQRHNHHCRSLNRQAISGQNVPLSTLAPRMDEPHHPDQQTRDTAEHKVHQQDALEPLPFKLPLPRENSCDQYRNGGECRYKKIAGSCRSELTALRPLAEKIKQDTNDE